MKYLSELTVSSFYSKVSGKILENRYLHPKYQPLKYITPFMTLMVISLGKMLSFGQIELFIGSDFQSFWNSFQNIPTLELMIMNKRSISKQQIDLHSNNFRYIDSFLTFWFYWSSKTHRFVWPAILYLLAVAFLLKILLLKLKPVLKKPAYVVIFEKVGATEVNNQ